MNQLAMEFADSASTSESTKSSQQRLRLECLDHLLLELDSRPEQCDCLKLDLDNTYPETAAGAVLSAALLGTLGRRAAHVKLPKDPDHLDRLAASGLVFALANRPGATETDPQIGPLLSLWKLPWTPGSSHQLNLFSAETDSNKPTVFGPRHAAFVNPHYTGTYRGRSEISSLVPAWLEKIISTLGGKNREESQFATTFGLLTSLIRIQWPRRMKAPRRYDFVRDVGSILQELVENIVEHGSRPESPRLLRSLVLVSLTSGKDADRVHLTVMDNGAGILETVRPKLEKSSNNCEDRELVKELFTGDLYTQNRARGMGLPRVWRIVQKWSGSLSLWTSKCQVRSAKSGDWRTHSTSFSIEGSVLTLSLPIRKLV